MAVIADAARPGSRRCCRRRQFFGRPSPAGRAAIAVLAGFAGQSGPGVLLAAVLEQARTVVSGRALRADIETTVGPLA
jgi:histidine ammonia-lyase